MIECLWVDWNINKGNANTNDSNWSSFTFNDFVDADGNPTPIQVATTLLMPILSYQFEPCAPNAVATTKDKATLEKFLREGAPHRLEFSKRFELRQSLELSPNKAAAARLKIEPDALRAVLDTNGRQKAVVTVDEVQAPPKQDVFVRVFVNKPDASAATPIEDPHYAGSFAFFCCEAPHHEGAATPAPASPSPTGKPAVAARATPAATPTPGATTNQKLRYLVDATQTVRRLNQAGSLSSDVEITLVVVPVDEQRRVETQAVRLGRVELATATF